jgi:hypothetical protein
MDESGAHGRILHHVDEAPPPGSEGDAELLDAVTAHVQGHLGPVADVLHQIVSPWVHVDVLVAAPTQQRPFHTLVTCGMAERAMVPWEPDPALEYAELVLALPSDWPLQAPEGGWPLKLLQDTAELPHRFQTWLHLAHTVPNGAPKPQPYARGCPFSGIVLAPPLLTPEGFDTLAVGDRQVRFLGVIPLYADEMDLKLEQGVEALFDRLDAAGVTEGLDVTRASVADPRPRRFGLRRRRT